MSSKRGNIVVQELEPCCQLGDGLVDDFVKPRILGMVKTATGRDGSIDHEERRPTFTIIENPDVEKASLAFLRSLRKFQEKQKKNKDVDIDVALDPNKRHGWDDVIGALQEAEQQYLGVKDNGPLGRIRECLRKCEDAKGGVELWLKLLPSESWQGSLLCGGLKIIVGVAASIGSTRRLVTDTIEQIPLSIKTAFKLYELYPKEVHKYVARVLAANLDVMKECIDFLRRSPWGKVAKAAFLGDSHDKGLKEKLSAMKTLQDQMEKEASLAKQEKDHESHVVLSDVAKQTDSMVKNLELLNKTVKDLLSEQEKRLDIEKYLQDQLRLKDTQALAWRWRHQTLQAQNLQHAKQQAEEQAEQWAEQYRDGLLQFLAYEEDVKIRDLYNSLRIGHTLSSQAQDFASNILLSEKVQTWLGDQNSSVLVINAMERTGLTTHSTASYFSSLLLISLKKIPQDTKTISWFCGQHVQDPSLASMLANLVGQLLSEALEGARVEELQAPVEQGNCQSLTMLFARYLRLQLRKTPVYCVIDSMSWYEDFRRLEDLFEMWAELARLTRYPDPGSHPLKVLATSPSRCSRIGTQVDFTKPIVYSAQDEISTPYSMINFMQGSHEIH